MLTKSQLKDLLFYFDNEFNKIQFDKLNNEDTIFIMLPKFDTVSYATEILGFYFDKDDNPITREKFLENVISKLKSDLEQMVGFYFDVFNGDCLQINEAFQFMRDRGFVDKNGEEIHGEDDK